MANTVDWAYLNAGFGSPRVTPAQSATPHNTNRTPTPSIFAKGVNTPTVNMSKLMNGTPGGSLNGAQVADMKGSIALAAANARLNNNPNGAAAMESKLAKLDNLQNQQLLAIQNQTEASKKDVLNQLYTQYVTENQGVGGGTSSNGSFGDLPKAKQELASAQVNHLLADRDVQGKQAEFQILSERYQAVVNENKRLKDGIVELQNAHDMPVPVPQSVELPLLKNTVVEAHQQLVAAINARSNAENALDRAEHVVNNMQNASADGEDVRQASNLAMNTIKDALARQNGV